MTIRVHCKMSLFFVCVNFISVKFVTVILPFLPLEEREEWKTIPELFGKKKKTHVAVDLSTFLLYYKKKKTTFRALPD